MRSVLSSGLGRFRSSLSVGVLLLVTLLAGCVTVTDSRFAQEEDEDKAVDDYVQLATAYLSQGNYERSRKHLERALELQPDDAGAEQVGDEEAEDAKGADGERWNDQVLRRRRSVIVIPTASRN